MGNKLVSMLLEVGCESLENRGQRIYRVKENIELLLDSGQPIRIAKGQVLHLLAETEIISIAESQETQPDQFLRSGSLSGFRLVQRKHVHAGVV